jgi:hypothetical protein
MTDEAFPGLTNVTGLFPERSTLAKRFPPPWTVEPHAESYVIRDSDSNPLGCVYFVQSPHQTNDCFLTRDQAWSMANNIANLPNLLREEE